MRYLVLAVTLHLLMLEQLRKQSSVMIQNTCKNACLMLALTGLTLGLDIHFTSWSSNILDISKPFIKETSSLMYFLSNSEIVRLERM